MKKKIFVTILCILLSTTPMNLSMANTAVANATETTDSGIVTYSNKTGYKYKVINGRVYKRLWSYTYNRWEEPKWTLA